MGAADRRIVAGTLLPALSACLLQAAAARAQQAAPPPRGPIELREEWLPAQNRLTLPALAPDVLPAGAARLRLSFDWGNDFGWQQDVRGEQPADRRYMVDGEHRTLALELRRGLGGGVEVGARLPLRWRGGGMLDGVIDAFHQITLRLGLPDNQRSSFETDRLRVEGTDRAGNGVSWDAPAGTGLGNLELSAGWALAGGASRARLALVGRLGLPTGTGAFDADGVEAGLQLLAAAHVADRLDLYAGVGGTAFSDAEVGGLEYSTLRGAGFLVLEWRVARAVGLLLELNGASRLITNLADYPGLQSYLRIGARLDVSARVQLEAGFCENLAHQQATTDFSVFVGLTRSF